MDATKIHLLLLLFTTITSCNSEKKNVSAIEDLPTEIIKINSSDITQELVGNFLRLDSYIILSREEIIGEVQRIIIKSESIYLMDNQDKIFCYNMKGNLIFKIDQQGPGPQEYIHINDFGIDEPSERLFVYDDYSRRMLVFNMKTGIYLSEFSTKYMLPYKFGIVDGTFFFNNADDRRIVDPNKQKCYLLYSENGEETDNYFLPHDAIATYHFALHPFYYNEDKLLYNKAFEGRVYLLEKGKVTPLYDIELPNQLPMKQIEAKLEHWDLVRSSYSYDLADIYMSGQIIHFTFSKDGQGNTCYYDLASDKILFCGPKLLDEAKKNLPFYSIIKGVYKGNFYSLVTAFEIEWWKETKSELFPEDLKTISPDDNYVIAFYKVIK
jgi:Zn/Cd-binding protein ZinT